MTRSLFDMRKNNHHLEFIRALPCVRCNNPAPNQSAHVRIGNDGGMGLKPSDRYTVPLCGEHHSQQHNVGEVTFWGRKLEYLDGLTNALYVHSGNLKSARRSIRQFQKGEW